MNRTLRTIYASSVHDTVYVFNISIKIANHIATRKHVATLCSPGAMTSKGFKIAS